MQNHLKATSIACMKKVFNKKHQAVNIHTITYSHILTNTLHTYT